MGWSFSSLATSPETSRTAAAPSLIWLLLPAVTVPFSLKAGLSRARASRRGVGARALVHLELDVLVDGPAPVVGAGQVGL